MKPRFGKLIPLALLACLNACATSHLVHWSRGENSTYDRPEPSKSIYVRAGGTVLAFPVALSWDIVTFPLQWFWDVHPYGTENAPESYEGK
ncbi:MAG: hypothetical protein IT457_12955 [Planctomycetes bacterium]|jgi:hypothetical protein|nr:hypothetical protein [Planctomycetota bacterium]